MLVLPTVPGAAHALDDSGVYVVRHVEPIVFLPKRAVHTAFSGVSGYWRMMCEILDACAK